MSIYFDVIKKKHPKFLLALLLTAFIAGLAIFASLADKVRGGDTLAFDTAILLSIHLHASPLLDTVFYEGTKLGGSLVVASISIALIVFLIRRKYYRRASLAAAIIGGTTLANSILKLFFERHRPELWEQLVQEQSFSFPSGHAMASAALGLTIIVILWNTRWRAMSIILALLYILFIGFSRLYLGVHYPTDILAGWIASALWVSVVAWLIYPRNLRSHR